MARKGSAEAKTAKDGDGKQTGDYNKTISENSVTNVQKTDNVTEPVNRSNRQSLVKLRQYVLAQPLGDKILMIAVPWAAVPLAHVLGGNYAFLGSALGVAAIQTVVLSEKLSNLIDHSINRALDNPTIKFIQQDLAAKGRQVDKDLTRMGKFVSSIPRGLHEKWATIQVKCTEMMNARPHLEVDFKFTVNMTDGQVVTHSAKDDSKAGTFVFENQFNIGFTNRGQAITQGVYREPKDATDTDIHDTDDDVTPRQSLDLSITKNDSKLHAP